METHAGKLLVATPLLIDPHFWRTVIFMLQHDEEGTVGIVLNRPTPELVADHLPEWERGGTEPQQSLLRRAGGARDGDRARAGSKWRSDGPAGGEPGRPVDEPS